MFKDRNVDHIHNTYWINLLLIAQIIIIPLLLTTFISTLSTAQKSNTEQQAKVIFKTLSSEYEKIVSDSEDILATWSKDITENKLEDNPCSSRYKEIYR
ncbi:hypothetical protein HYV12_02095 [Candidatus Dojkabacteria bacterium]|nr:hypothetical protein [Candidatus Dojkabacteria bacterium]